MKKSYEKPAMMLATIGTMKPLASSGGVWSDKIGYGGKDDGSHIPGSRWHNRLWDDEEDDDWLIE